MDSKLQAAESQQQGQQQHAGQPKGNPLAELNKIEVLVLLNLL
jgi:hypothetical protein